MNKIHMRKKMRTTTLSEAERMLKGGLVKKFKWLNAVKMFPPSTTVKWPKPLKLKFPHDILMEKNRRRSDYIPELLDMNKLDITGSVDYQLSKIQLKFIKLGYKEEKAYYFAKLKVRNELLNKLRNLELYEKKRLGMTKSENNDDLYSLWLKKLNNEIEWNKENVPKSQEEIVKNLLKKSKELKESHDLVSNLKEKIKNKYYFLSKNLFFNEEVEENDVNKNN